MTRIEDLHTQHKAREEVTKDSRKEVAKNYR